MSRLSHTLRYPARIPLHHPRSEMLAEGRKHARKPPHSGAATGLGVSPPRRFSHAGFHVKRRNQIVCRGTKLSRQNIVGNAGSVGHSPKRGRKLRGVMIGRMAMQSPWLFRHCDEAFYGCEGPRLTRRQVVEKYCDYVEKLQKTHRIGLYCIET